MVRKFIKLLSLVDGEKIMCLIRKDLHPKSFVHDTSLKPFTRYCVICLSANCLTSLYAGFAVFSVLGFMAHHLNTPIADVVSSGKGLLLMHKVKR